MADRERRREARRDDRLRQRGRRSLLNLALDDELAPAPYADSSLPGGEPLRAVDGDSTTAWRGAPGPGRWTLPLRRPVHLGLLRFHLGDDADQGVPEAFRWEVQPPRGGACEPDAPWITVGRRDDRDDNTFTHGPRDVHAQRQALFVDADACALRLVVEATAKGQGPVLRELIALESAPSLLRGAQAEARRTWTGGPLGEADAAGAVDGTYERFWAGAPGAGPWELTVRLPEPQQVDRLWMLLGYDGVTVPRAEGPGRVYAGAHLPLDYSVATSHDDDPAHLMPLPEASPPSSARGQPLPVRRRLVRLTTPRPVKMLRITIRRASGLWGEAEGGAPVVRELGLFAADDPRPVITEPVFFSVDANPAGLTASQDGGEAYADGLFARTLYHRLRRSLLSFDADSRWTADTSRKRDRGTGRFLEVIEGDDPLLSAPLIEASAPPPVLLLSGSLDWEFDDHTAPWPSRRNHWSWDVDAPATADDRGMGHLRALVQRRAAPFVGFCGGAQILALLDALPPSPANVDLDRAELLDRVLLRNENHPIRGLLTRKDPYERAWWFDPPELDAARPLILFDPIDPLFNAPSRSGRSGSRELPTSHGDMLRASAFSGPLRRLHMTAWSHFCRPWIDPSGPEPTWPDPTDPSRRCVLIPQAFRSLDAEGYPLLGFQFHPEQRDFQRLAPGSPRAARGDAINLIANSLDLVLDAYTRLFWPEA